MRVVPVSRVDILGNFFVLFDPRAPCRCGLPPAVTLTWIDIMDAPESQDSTYTQTYLIQRDAGLLCRILNLYAARGLDVLDLGYEYAASHVMKLNVSVDACCGDNAEIVRILVDKASTFVGVLAACEHVPAQRRAA